MSTQPRRERWEDVFIHAATDVSLARNICEAVHELLRADIDLLSRDVNEKTITGRLADYLRPRFSGWDVDCEYNRDGHGVKKVDGRIVVPDIIIHRRGTSDNLLVIEVKKSNTNKRDKEDLKKLREFRTSHLNYRNALFIKFKVAPQAPGVQRVQWV